MSNTRVSLNQLETEFEIVIKIPFQPFIKLLEDKLNPAKPEIKADTILSCKEASHLLHVSCRTLHRWRKAGKLKYIMRGSRVFFKRSFLEELDVERRLTGVRTQ